MNWNQVPITLDDVSLKDGLNPIIESLSLDFHPSKVTVLMGSSGCGKSTVLKTAAGLTPISGGHVRYGDTSIYRLSQKEFAKMQKNTGFMFQDGALWANMNIQGNLSLPQLVADKEADPSLVSGRIKEALDSFSMYGIRESRPAALSAGERKIISFLRAIITEPDILFLDEPTTFIDRKSSLELIRQLFRFKKEGKTILMVTHDFKLARSLGDYFVFLNDRKIEMYDTVEKCLASDNPLWRNFLADSIVDGSENLNTGDKDGQI